MFNLYGMNGIPASFDHINVYNNMRKPSKVHAGDNVTAWFYKRYLIQKILSVFKFDGIPENWSKDYFLYTLFVFGYCAVINTDKFGVIPQHCTLSGYDVFYRPNTVIIANPLLKPIRAKIGTETELVRMQPDYCGCWDIVENYGELLALTSESVGVNLINSKFAYVFAAENKAAAESLKKMYDQIASGDPAAIVDKQLYKDDGSPAWELFTQNLAQNYIAGDLLEDMAKIDSRFNTEVGIPNVNIAKLSGVSDNEVQSNNVSTQTKCELWLETISDSLKKVNDMFGLNISVTLRFKQEGAEDYAGNDDDIRTI